MPELFIAAENQRLPTLQNLCRGRATVPVAPPRYRLHNFYSSLGLLISHMLLTKFNETMILI